MWSWALRGPALMRQLRYEAVEQGPLASPLRILVVADGGTATCAVAEINTTPTPYRAACRLTPARAAEFPVPLRTREAISVALLRYVFRSIENHAARCHSERHAIDRLCSEEVFMANDTYSKFPGRGGVDAHAATTFDADGMTEAIGMLKSMPGRTDQVCAGSEVNRLAQSQLHRLEWILCKRTGHGCPGDTELRVRCAKEQRCVLNETTTVKGL